MNISIGEVLKGVRKCSGITQAEFAKEIQVSQSYISKLEKNETSPSVEVLDQYAEYFDIEPDLLLKFRKSEDSKSLSQRIRIALFRKFIYDEKDSWEDGTEL